MTTPSASNVATRHLQASMSPMAKALVGYLKTRQDFQGNILSAIASTGETLGEPPRKAPPSWMLPKPKGRKPKTPVVAPTPEPPLR